MTKLEAYLRRQRAVEGWLDPYSARFIAAIGELQAREGVAGSVGEIGVHRGRLFILLKLLARPGERACAIDLFENQDLNVDHSGNGDEALLLANLRRHADDKDIAIIKRSSVEVDPADILTQTGRARLFSIDGGHTAECARNDLALAERVLVDYGVAILDDFFNQSWPDVSVGTAAYIADPSSQLRPFAITPNKVYLARAHAHRFYREALMASQRGYFEKESVMFGASVAIFGVEAETWRPTRRLKRWAKTWSLGRRLAEARRRTKGSPA